MKKLLLLVLMLVAVISLTACNGSEAVKVYGVDEFEHEVSLVTDYVYEGETQPTGNYVEIDGKKYELYVYYQNASQNTTLYRPQYVVYK